jgi:hypothetical protein
VALYRDLVRAVVHHGDQYLLTRPPDVDGSGEWAAIWYVAKDASRGVLFAFRLGSEQAARVFPLPGLIDGRGYRVRLFDGSVSRVSADQVTVTVPGKFQSELCMVEAA